jgi:signal transduction histidine kinase
VIESHIRELLDAVVGVAGDLDLPDVLRRIVRSACELVDAQYGALGILGPDQDFSEFIEVGIDRTEWGRIGELSTDRGVLAVPIGVRETVFGNLYLAEKRGGGEFTEHDEALVAALAVAAGIAAGNATLFEQMRRREQWLEASHQVISALLTGEEPTATFRLIAERARVVSGASVGAFARPLTDDGSTLVFEVVDSEDPHERQELAGVTIPAKETATGLAFSSGRPVVVRRYGEHLAAERAGSATRLPAMVKDLDSAIAIPLSVGDETLGVLLVAKVRDAAPFTDADVQLVQTFAKHATLALEFDRAEEDRRRLAVFEDRVRIARDLHDLVIQRLFATGLGLEGLSRLIPQPEVAERVTGFVHDLDRTIRDVRNSIFSLQEPAEVQGSLRSELLRLAHDAAEMLGFEPQIGFEGPLDTMVPDRVRGELVATLREALSNAARHAAASTVSVEIMVDRRGRQLTVTVADDGVGIPESLLKRSGLANLAERAARWNGSLSVRRTGERGGTTLAWTITLPPATGG